MLQDLATQFNHVWPVIAAVATVFFLVPSRFLKLLGQYDSHWSRRHYRRLKELRASDTAQGPFGRYLDESIKLEAFRIASGIQANRLKADLLIRIALTGDWTRWQIRQIAPYIIATPEHPNPVFTITKRDTIGVWLARIFGGIFVLIGIASSLVVMWMGQTFGAFVSGLAVQAMFVFGWVVGSLQTESYGTARRFEKYLEAHPELLLDEDLTL